MEILKDTTQFASLQFCIFFLLVFTICWSMGNRRRLRNAFLLASSYFFYGQLGLTALAILLFSTVFNYCCGQGLVATKPANRKLWLWCGLGFNLGVLGLFKYFNFFRESAEILAITLGLEVHLQVLPIILPIGISFYTFQAMTYLVDLYRGHGVRARSITDFALYLAYFPQILIGPICRSRDLLPQLEAPPPRRIPDVPKALLLILSGLFKKVVIATLLYEHGVTSAFQSPEDFSAVGLWGGMIGYTIQLYCDFSGYTDMARGFSLLLGIHLPENFRSPYVATNLGEFWKRWHITFSQWLRDYIYLPLGGSRRSKWRISWNLFLTFLFCGFWHGASWGYVIWGAAHGVAMAAHKQNRDRKRAKGLDPNQAPAGISAVIGWIYTFGFVALSRVVFQTSDLETSWVYYKRLFDFTATGQGAEWTLVIAIFAGLAINFWGPKLFEGVSKLLLNVEMMMQRFSRNQNWHSAMIGMLYALSTVTILVGTLVVILLLRPKEIPPYLYFRF